MGRTEDEVRDEAKIILGFDKKEKKVKQGTGQITTFNQLGFKGNNNKPDGWYLPENKNDVAIILETKSEKEDIYLSKWEDELFKNLDIISIKYSRTIGILYNGKEIRVYKNKVELKNVSNKLENKKYYISLLNKNSIDKQKIYDLTKRINDSLHTDFKIKNLHHRMIFTACALVAKRYGAILVSGMDYEIFHSSILSTLNKSLEDSKKQNNKLNILIEVYTEIKIYKPTNQDVMDNFMNCITEISDSVNSDYWNGEDVMGIFFNEFNRYKGKSDNGQVFTPDHITSFMYRLIEVNQNDKILDAACGSGAFLVKSMSNMIKESGGVNTEKAKDIKEKQLYGIEFDREIYALACANMLIHKDGKTNLENLDTRYEKACSWIKEQKITKVLMNPPFEAKYGCLLIVKNVLDNVPPNTKCAFILPDNKLEASNKEKVKGEKILKEHRLEKIIKLPEKTFSEGVDTSIFIFNSGTPQNKKEIFTCYIEDDGLETVKNQGRQDIKDKWQEIEDKWVDIIKKQSGDESIKWINPEEYLSYPKAKKEFEIYEEDFRKTIYDYIIFENQIDLKELNKKIINKVLYNSDVEKENGKIKIIIKE